MKDAGTLPGRDATLLKRFGPWAAALAIVASALVESGSVAALAVAPITISQIPLTVAIPAHPQVIIALGNSQSMDGDLSGAIMTGSGALGGAIAAGLANSSSPTNFTIPAGFTPPVNAGAGGVAPYTVTSGGTEYDNSASRLNVAKAGISAILNNFMEYADFALMDYSTSGVGLYETWVYLMSPMGANFTFTSTPGGSRYVANPCYNANTSLGDAYDLNCYGMTFKYGATAITQPYLVIGVSSDDPAINDVLYAPGGYAPPVCVTFGGPSPATPFPPNDSLANYKNGSVYESYSNDVNACGGVNTTGPTNAGYVPYSPQVMYVARGFGYYGSQSSNNGTTVVAMKSSGAAPTAATTAAAIANFTAYLQPETNNTGTTEIKAEAVQSPLAGLLTQAKNYYVNTNPASTNGCSPTRYVVLVTDGLPTEDLAGNLWPPLGSASATGYGVTASFNGNGSLNSTNDQALTDAINVITAAHTAGIKTYVIGLGAGVNPANNAQAAATLTAMAVAGGTGSYFAATSPNDLTNDMQVILAQILAATQSTSSATVNTTGLNTNSMVFQPSFDTSDVNQDWTGDIKAYPINATTGVVITGTLAWSAQAQLDAEAAGSGWDTNRIIATWDPVALTGIPFRWNSGTPATGIATSTVLGQELETNTSDPDGEHALRYLRGDAHWQISNGEAYRNRTHILADIVDSAPLYVGPAAGPYQSASYYAFETTYANRQPVIYAGANDGMLHAFSATTGSELFAYIPHGAFANLINLTSPFYNEKHQFFVDGPAEATDVQFDDGSWHTVLVGGEHGGGNTIYALDVTNPAGITSEQALASSVLWEFSDPNMGDSYSDPAIAQTAAGASGANLGFTVFFGNGYDSPSQTPYLYAVNPQTGASLPGTPISLCAKVAGACNAAVTNGLSSVVVTNNLGGVGAAATTLYAGDLQGNLWRVDITNASAAQWVVTLLAQVTDPTGARQPITTTPTVSLNPDFPRVSGTMVYVGTGQMLGIPDLSSVQVQTMYGVYDSGTNPSTLTRANLVAQALSSSVVSGVTLRFVSGSQLNLPTQNGWYVDFNLISGERLVTDARLDGGALVATSVIPNANTCTSGDTAYLMEFDYAGGAFTNPQFNYLNTGAVTAPPLQPANGVLLGNVYAAAPVFDNFTAGVNGTGGAVALITESNGTIQSFSQKGNAEQRYSWSEIR